MSKSYAVNTISRLTGQRVYFEIYGIPYPTSGSWPVDHDIWIRVFDYIRNVYSYSIVDRVFPRPGNNAGLETEHIFERQAMRNFVKSTIDGILPSGIMSSFPAMDHRFWTVTAFHPLPNVQGLGVANEVTPIRRLMTILGATGYEDVFVLASKTLNRTKGSIWATGYNDPTGLNAMQDSATLDIDGFLTAIGRALGTFSYLNHPMVHARLSNIIRTIRDELRPAERQHITMFGPGARLYLCDMFDEWLSNYFATMTSNVATWAINWIEEAISIWNNNTDSPYYTAVMMSLFGLATIAAGLHVNLNGIPGQ